MKGMGSGAVDTDNPFTEVMGLVTQMYKQTAIAKVMGDQVVFKCSFSPLTLEAGDFSVSSGVLQTGAVCVYKTLKIYFIPLCQWVPLLSKNKFVFAQFHITPSCCCRAPNVL